MFQQVGKKIQAVVSVIFFVQFIVACISGILIGKLIYEMSDNMVTAIFIGIITVAIITFFCWVMLLMIYAFGKIEECCEEQNRLLGILIAKHVTLKPTEKRVCQNCGKELEEEALFCSNCGTNSEI